MKLPALSAVPYQTLTLHPCIPPHLGGVRSACQCNEVEIKLGLTLASILLQGLQGRR